MLAIRSGQFCPDAERSGRWVGCESIEEAVSLAANARVYWDIGYNHMHNSDEEDELIEGWDGSFEVLDFEPTEEFEASEFEVLCCEKTGSGSNLSPDRVDDSTPLSALLPPGSELKSRNMFRVRAETIASDSDEISGWSSSSESDADSDLSEADRRGEIEGMINASDLVAPSDLVRKKCFQHVKSLKFHFVEKTSDDSEFFRCGRRVNANYRHVTVAPAFTMHGCLTCFGVRSDPNDQDLE